MLGLDENALPKNIIDQITPPKFCLSLVQVDYVKVMQKSLYYMKLEAKEKKR